MRRTCRLAAASLWVLLCASCGTVPPSAPVNKSSPALTDPPPVAARSLPVSTPRIEVTDSYHGVSVVDPYRWLEEDTEQVKAWTEAQNERTSHILEGIAGRADIQAGIERLMAVGELEAPVPRKTRRGTWRYFFLRRQGMDNQPTLIVREGLEGPDRVVVDVNDVAADGTAAIDWYYPSMDGRYVAYGVSRDGTEESTLHVREVGRAGEVRELEERIARTRHCSLAWKPDDSGFYYTRYPARGEVPEGQEGYHRKVFEHRLGQPSDRDVEVFGQGREMTDSPSVVLSPDGRWLVVVVYQGWAKAELYVRDLRRPVSAFAPVAVGKEATYTPIATNDAIFVLTNDDAPRGRLVRVDPLRPAREHWTEVVPEGQHALEDVTLVGGQLIAAYQKDASSLLLRFDLKGKLLGEIPLPVLGTAGVRGALDGDEAFVGFTSFAVSAEVLRISLGDAGKQSLWQRMDSPMRASDVLVDQFFATSKDGTRVPYFVVRKAGVVLDGTAPAVLAAYGGFNLSMLPQFLRGAGVLVEAGGVFVQASLRGGGEYGEAWHRAGMLANKQNVFDDMIAVTEDVVRRKVAAKDRLAISGGSNGGLLVGVMVVQRPDLFRAAVARVPLMDMLRYQHFLIAKLWVSEYGSSEDPDLFPVLRAYSPYHNVREGTAYPAVLITAAEGDSRVHPFHARKMTAALQHATASDEPILARIESKAGHGAGKPAAKRVQEYTDVYAFLMWKLGMLSR